MWTVIGTWLLPKESDNTVTFISIAKLYILAPAVG